ncbi:hypothetical protein MMC12_001427 [Toensbergia leucococca]|nr:hypothetical protein [Toensbergia leucococca]
MAALLTFLYEQIFVLPPVPQAKFTGQTIIVTGSNVGLGLEAARHFTSLDAERVILAVRTVEKGEAAKKSIEESTNRKDVVEVWQLDLSSFESVKQFVQKAKGLRRLDAVVENAGICTAEYRTVEGNESTITTNVISTFLLGIMILPKLRESATKYNIIPHLTFVSSEVHGFTSFPEKSNPNIFEALNSKESAKMGDRYNVSKLLEIFYCRELATHTSQTKKPPVTINILNPGLCHSSLNRDQNKILEFAKWLMARTTEQGSRTLVLAAAGGVETHGQYLSCGKVSKPAPLVLSEEGVKAQKQIWEELSGKLEAIQPGIMANV